AGRLDFAVGYFSILLFSVDFGGVDALHAVGALLHDSAAADRHVRVVQQLEAGSFVIGVQIEIEPPHFVGAVVGTVASADAAVVDHIVKAFGAVGSGLHGADQLARGILALHAGNRLVVDGRVIGLAVVVGVDANPVHGAPAAHLVFADHGDIVLGLAGDHAGAASGAGIEVDGHAPGVAGVREFRIHGQRAWRRFRAFVDGGRILAVIGDIAFMNDVAAGVENVVHLGAGEGVGSGNLVHFHAQVLPHGGGGAQAVGVKAHAGRGPAGVRAAIAEVQGDGLIHMAGLDPDRSAQLAALVSELQDAAVFDAQPVRIARADNSGIVPGQFGDGLGQFLQPAAVGEAAIVDGGVGAEDHFHLPGHFFPAELFGDGFAVDGPGLGGERRAFDHAVVNRAAPPGFEIRAFVPVRPIAFDDLVGAGIGRAGERLQNLAGGAAAVERLDERLLDGDGAVEGAGVAPGFQVMRFGQEPLADRRGFVFVLA